jgi:putative addiction module component (TIGR02574 family)
VLSCSALLGGAPRVSLAFVSKTGEKLLEDALKLTLSERAELAAELLASLDGAPDADAEAAWAAEIERRAADPGRPWPEVRDRIRNRLAKR